MAFSESTESIRSRNLTLVNYCHKDCEPMKNIMRLPKAEAFLLAEKFAASHPETTAFYRFADFENYYVLREKQDAFLHEKFISLGGEPEEEHPLSFVIEGSDYLKQWFDGGTETKLPLNTVDPKHISFTVGDSGSAYDREGRVTLYLLPDLEKLLASHDGDLQALLLDSRKKYIEAQLWSDRYLY